MEFLRQCELHTFAISKTDPKRHYSVESLRTTAAHMKDHRKASLHLSKKAVWCWHRDRCSLVIYGCGGGRG